MKSIYLYNKKRSSIGKRSSRNKYEEYSSYVKHPPAGIDWETWSKKLAKELNI